MMPNNIFWGKRAKGSINGKGMNNSNKYFWKELMTYKKNKENPAPHNPWMIPSITNGKRMKPLVAPKRWRVSMESCFECMINLIVFDTRVTDIINIAIPKTIKIPKILANFIK